MEPKEVSLNDVYTKLNEIQQFLITNFKSQMMPPQPLKSSVSISSMNSSSSSSNNSTKKKCIYIIPKTNKQCSCVVSNKSINNNYCAKHLKFECTNKEIDTKKQINITQTQSMLLPSPAISNSSKTIKKMIKKPAFELIDDGDHMLHKETNFLFNKTNNVVIGVKTVNGILNLSECDISVCKTLGFKYDTSDIKRIDEMPELNKPECLKQTEIIKNKFDIDMNFNNVNIEDEGDEGDENGDPR
jgi:hypothetical protein